jgi:hypothetical protein
MRVNPCIGAKWRWSNAREEPNYKTNSRKLFEQRHLALLSLEPRAARDSFYELQSYWSSIALNGKRALPVIFRLAIGWSNYE